MADTTPVTTDQMTTAINNALTSLVTELFSGDINAIRREAILNSVLTPVSTE